MRFAAFWLNWFFLLAAHAMAHDTWVQTNTNLVRTGDVVHVDLLLGNHGNQHRDFKLASKASLKHSALQVILPDGKRLDLADRLADVGYAPNEGFWTARFVPTEPGFYQIAHTLDQVMSYGPVRAVKSGKACFVVSDSLDRVPLQQPGFEIPLGHALELVTIQNPVIPMGPGKAIGVRLLFHGQPLAGKTVSFIPRGQTLAEGFDEQYERVTDERGEASFTPKVGNYYLVVAHHEDNTQQGEGYEKIKYSATLTVFVPEICGCCIE
jgi:uncharacterized GH25 family protein